MQDRYVNPFTDFGFKRLFEAAEIARFDPVARQMKTAGEPVDKIVAYTGLTVEQIRQL